MIIKESVTTVKFMHSKMENDIIKISELVYKLKSYLIN